jgi:hypothetical protein
MEIMSDDSTLLSTKQKSMEIKPKIEANALSLYGANAISAHKTKGPAKTSDNVLGFAVNLNTESFRPKDGSLEKGLYYFLTLGELAEYTIRQSQVLHGLAEYLSRNLDFMREYVKPLLIQGNPRNPFHRVKTTPTMRFCMEMWQAMLILICSNPDQFNRPMSSILKSTGNPDYIVRTDAGPSLIGARIYDGHTNGPLFSTQYQLPWTPDEGNESHQNLREHAGHLTALLILSQIERTPDRCTFSWETDSVVAKAWVDKDKVNSASSEAGLFAQAAKTLIRARTGLILHGTTWLSTEEMVTCEVDLLSREKFDERSFAQFHEFKVMNTTGWNELFEMLDPHAYEDDTSKSLRGLHKVIIAVTQAVHSICGDRTYVH